MILFLIHEAPGRLEQPVGCESAETGSRLSVEFRPVALLSTSCGPAAIQAMFLRRIPGRQEAVPTSHAP